MEKLCFILTKNGCQVDEAVAGATDECCASKEAFTGSPYETLYEQAFQERPAFFDAAGIFLCQMSEQFISDLAVVPGIELSREKTEILPSAESMERLLKSVPFVLGSEHVTEVWIRRQYRKLRDVFRRQIAAYSGAVSLYFAEKNQKLHIPERIFFHLVESRDES